ncbi:MAG: ribose 5-phosphate isomerase B [Clostridiales bacterium]|jgi:ribose 5-phosphate isomerase B|nr:ribose 5-phosphate isomerase B [Clostridiales bacterium]
MKIVISNDHVSVEMKKAILKHIQSRGHDCVDYGPSLSESVDYPIFAEQAARLIASGEFDQAILICGTGIGMMLAANKVHGVRAIVCSEPYSAKLAREHNNANVLCFGSRVIGVELAKLIVDTWLAAEFQGGRHATRVNMLESIAP